MAVVVLAAVETQALAVDGIERPAVVAVVEKRSREASAATRGWSCSR